MACLKLEVESDEEEMFDLKPTVSVEMKEEDTKHLALQVGVDNVKTEGYGDVITIAPLNDLHMKEEPIDIEYKKVVSVRTTELKTCHLGSAQDTETQLVETVESTAVVHRRPPNTPSSSSTRAEPMDKKLDSQPITPYQCTVSSRSDPETDSNEHTGKKPHPCTLCEKSFQYLSQLKQHIVVHSRTKKSRNQHFNCEICGKVLTYANSLKLHMRIHTGEGRSVCQTCGKTFALPKSLKIHSLAHNAEKPFKCKICCKCFATSSQLKQHLVTHAGESQHQCYICGEAFAGRSSLIIHSLTHAGEKPYKCKVCDEDFTTSSLLKQHSLEHKPKRAHKCHICCEAFAWQSSLIVHSLTHTGEKPFEHTICDKVS